MKLSGKSVLLTGLFNETGVTLARALAERGARLWLVGAPGQGLERICRALPHAHYHQTFELDDHSPAALGRLHEQILLSARLDMLIYYPGEPDHGLLGRHSHSEIQHYFSAQIEGPILLIRTLLDRFNSPGVILNIGSVLADVGHPGYSMTCAGAFALRGFSEALDRERGEYGPRVRYLSPLQPTSSAIIPPLPPEHDVLRRVSPEAVVEFVMRAITRDSRLAKQGRYEKLLIWLNRLSPWVADCLIQGRLSRLRRKASSPNSSG